VIASVASGAGPAGPLPVGLGVPVPPPGVLVGPPAALPASLSLSQAASNGAATATPTPSRPSWRRASRRSITPSA
jgi:hypothetical protein